MNSRIKAIRKSLHLTQQNMADSLGLKRNTVGAYEIGTIKPSDRTITDMCRIYNVNEVWLRTGVGDMFVQRSREDEIAAYMGRLLDGKCSEVEQAIVSVMARTSVEEWELIAKKARELVEELNEKEPGV